MIPNAWTRKIGEDGRGGRRMKNEKVGSDVGAEEVGWRVEDGKKTGEKWSLYRRSGLGSLVKLGHGERGGGRVGWGGSKVDGVWPCDTSWRALKETKLGASSITTK
jgi:hypothetical protein